jgi:hypothetical protein
VVLNRSSTQLKDAKLFLGGEVCQLQLPLAQMLQGATTKAAGINNNYRQQQQRRLASTTITGSNYNL